jgi:hypothetical protein
MEITLYDLIGTYEFSELIEVCTECFGDKFIRNACGFESVYNNLKRREDAFLGDCSIRLARIEADEYIEEAYTECVGVKDDDGTTWSLSLTPWAEWLGMTIQPTTIKEFDAKEIIARALWEMTFYGYTEEKIKDSADSLNDEAYIEFDEEDIEAIMNELDDIENEEDAKDYLRKYLKEEIDSSSSSVDIIE